MFVFLLIYVGDGLLWVINVEAHHAERRRMAGIHTGECIIGVLLSSIRVYWYMI